MVDSGTTFKNLGGEYELSAQLIEFTNLAKQARKEYITEVFYKNNSIPLFRSIPITKEEAIKLMSDTSITNAEIVYKIETLLEEASDSVRKKYRGIKSKRRNELLVILEEVRSLFNSDNELNNHESTENLEVQPHDEIEHANQN